MRLEATEPVVEVTVNAPEIETLSPVLKGIFNDGIVNPPGGGNIEVFLIRSGIGLFAAGAKVDEESCSYGLTAYLAKFPKE